MVQNEETEALERRGALQKFASANPDVPRKGLVWAKVDERVLIGRFQSPDFVRGLRQSLSSSGVPSTMKTNRFEAAVYVSESHRADAFGVLSAYQKKNPASNQKVKRIRRRYDLYFIFGITSFIAMSLLSYYHSSFLLWLSSLVCCIAAAWVFDRFQISRRWYGHYRFMLLDVLALIVVAAMIMAAINFQGP